jgi:PAS domain S-box-containing protein
MKGWRNLRLPESDRELREFLEHAATGLRFVSPDGRILWANKAELDLVGWSEDEYVGRHIADFVVDPAGTAQMLDRLARGETVGSFKTQLRTRKGSILQVLVDGIGLFRDGNLVHSRLMTRDITGLMEHEESARHRVEATSHLKDEFLALLSHELRTPLGAILVWLGLLKQGGFDQAEKDRALDIIERSARSLERIIEDLLHASRIAAGGLMLHPRRVDFREVVQLAVDTASADAAQKGVALISILDQGPLWIKGDAGRLQQAVSNLLSNAIKFTTEHGRVTVSLQREGTQAKLLVSDTGEGMSAEFLPMAFERFRQQDSTSTRAHHGLGLGLYVVRHVIENHAGVVTAKSAGALRGSEFTVLLPLTADAALDAVPALREPRLRESHPQGLRVLLVDDEEDVCQALRLILQQNGMEVATASSVKQGFELLQSVRPDVLLSDIAMPGEDGLSFIRRVRLLPPHQGGLTPAAALSAYASVADRRASMLAGFQHHLAKPVDPARLLAIIGELAPSAPGLHV